MFTVWCAILGLVLFDETSSPQVPDAVNYAGLCRWDCGDGERRTAVSWTELEAHLVRLTELDPVTGRWIAGALLQAAPLGTSRADLDSCLTFSGPAEPFIRINPTNDCCVPWDLDGDRDVDLADVVLWQRRELGS